MQEEVCTGEDVKTSQAESLSQSTPSCDVAIILIGRARSSITGLGQGAAFPAGFTHACGVVRMCTQVAVLRPATQNLIGFLCAYGYVQFSRDGPVCIIAAWW